MDQSDDIERIGNNLIIDHKRERTTTATWKTMRPEMISPAEFRNHMNGLLHSIVKISTELPRDCLVTTLGVEQIGLEIRAEYDLHIASPKTCSKLKPASAPVFSLSNLDRRFAAISSSLLPSVLRLSNKRLASNSR